MNLTLLRVKGKVSMDKPNPNPNLNPNLLLSYCIHSLVKGKESMDKDSGTSMDKSKRMKELKGISWDVTTFLHTL